MDTDIIRMLISALVILGGLAFLVFLVGLVIALIRKTLTKQDEAMRAVDESLNLARKHTELGTRLVQLTEHTTHQQNEMIRLLKLLCEQQSTHSSPTNRTDAIVDVTRS